MFPPYRQRWETIADRMHSRLQQETGAQTTKIFLSMSVEDQMVLEDSPICFGHFSGKDPICRGCSFKVRCKRVSGPSKQM